MSERDREMIARYAEGETLQAIGDHFGVSRERVRQIVVKHGGADAEAARTARLAAREAAASAETAAFLSIHGDTARALAERGVTRRRAVQRLTTLYPALSPEVTEDALRGSGITFDHDNQTNTFSNAALEAGIWFLLGSELSLPPDHVWAVVHLDQALLDELGPHLEAASVTQDEYATILGVIAAAQRRALEGDEVSITGKRYEELRLELLEAMGLPSAKGAKPWSPTRQTIMKRFGGWNDALQDMGLATATKGRAKGLLRFSEDDYLAAVAAFIAHCRATDTSTTFANYEAWVLDRRAAGERHPVGASIRNMFDSWGAALRAGEHTIVGSGT